MVGRIPPTTGELLASQQYALIPAPDNFTVFPRGTALDHSLFVDNFSACNHNEFIGQSILLEYNDGVI